MTKKINLRIPNILFLTIISAVAQVVYSQVRETGFDSCYYYSGTGQTLSSKEFRYYTADGKLQEIEETQYVDGKWYPDFRIIYSYNGNQDIIEVKTELFIREKGEWQLAGKKSMEYSGHLLTSQLIYQRLIKTDKNNIIQDQQQYRTGFSYDGGSHLLSETEEKREIDGWKQTKQITYSYQDGKMKTKEDGQNIEEYKYDKSGRLIQKERTRKIQDKKSENYLDRVTFVYDKNGLLSRQINEIYDIHSYQKISFIDRFNADQQSKYERYNIPGVTLIYRDEKKYNEMISHAEPKTKISKRWVTDTETVYTYNELGQAISIKVSYYDDPPPKYKKGTWLKNFITTQTYTNGKLQSSVTKIEDSFGSRETGKIIYYYH